MLDTIFENRVDVLIQDLIHNHNLVDQICKPLCFWEPDVLLLTGNTNHLTDTGPKTSFGERPHYLAHLILIAQYVNSYEPIKDELQKYPWFKLEQLGIFRPLPNLVPEIQGKRRAPKLPERQKRWTKAIPSLKLLTNSDSEPDTEKKENHENDNNNNNNNTHGIKGRIRKNTTSTHRLTAIVPIASIQSAREEYAKMEADGL